MVAQAIPSSDSVEATRPETRILVANFTGNGTGNPTFRADDATHGPILTLTRTGVGTYNAVMRHFYPTLDSFPGFSFFGTLPFTGRCSAIDYTVNPPTATFVFSVGAFETDLPTTTKVSTTWLVRTSARNG